MGSSPISVALHMSFYMMHLLHSINLILLSQYFIITKTLLILYHIPQWKLNLYFKFLLTRRNQSPWLHTHMKLTAPHKFVLKKIPWHYGNIYLPFGYFIRNDDANIRWSPCCHFPGDSGRLCHFWYCLTIKVTSV